MQKKILTVLLASMFMGSAWAEDKAIDIPAQDVPAALLSLSSQTGAQLLFTADELKSFKTKAISGVMSVEDALVSLLKDTNYTFKVSGNGAYVLRPVEKKLMLNEVTITATRTERNVGEVPASVSVLTAEKLKTKNRQNVYEALRDEEGLDFVTGQPGVAHLSSPVIRGVGASFSGSTAQIMVDSVEQDSVFSGPLGRGGLNFTSMQDVERIEVVRGPVSALYGPGTVGGVINVIPKHWKGDAGVEVNTSYGSNNTQTVGIATGATKENFDVRLSAYNAQSDGFITKPVATPGSKAGFDLAGKNWKDNKVGAIASFRPIDKHEITLDVQQYGTRSANNFGGRPNDRHNMDGQSSTLGYRFDLSDSTSIKTDIRSASYKQNYFYDKGDWLGLAVQGTVSAADLPLAYFGERTSDTTSFRVQIDTHPIMGNQLTAGYSFHAAQYTSSTTTVGGATSITGSKSRVDAIYVQDEQKLGAFTLTAGGRYDRIDLSPDTLNGALQNGSGSSDSIFNPRLGGRFNLDRDTSFYASMGTAYLPAQNLLKFVQPSTTRVDNPNLKPETSTSYEIGMNNQFTKGALRTSIFHTDYKDKITLGTDAVTRKGQWQNTAVTKVDGLEISYQGDFENGWQPYANFSYTDAKDYATANAAATQTTRVSPRKLNVGVTYQPDNVWSATLNARVAGGSYFNSVTAAQYEGEVVQSDLKLSYKLPVQGDKWDSFIACNNLTDKKYQPMNIGEWSDGRTFSIGISGKL